MVKQRLFHNYEKSYAKYKKRLGEDNKISKQNKELISNFDKDCKLKGSINFIR